MYSRDALECAFDIGKRNIFEKKTEIVDVEQDLGDRIIPFLMVHKHCEVQYAVDMYRIYDFKKANTLNFLSVLPEH